MALFDGGFIKPEQKQSSAPPYLPSEELSRPAKAQAPTSVSTANAEPQHQAELDTRYDEILCVQWDGGLGPRMLIRPGTIPPFPRRGLLLASRAMVLPDGCGFLSLVCDTNGSIDYRASYGTRIQRKSPGAPLKSVMVATGYMGEVCCHPYKCHDRYAQFGGFDCNNGMHHRVRIRSTRVPHDYVYF